MTYALSLAADADTQPIPQPFPRPDAARKSRRGRRAVMVASLAIVLFSLAAGGILALNIHHTFETLNSVSTPATSLGGAALGGNPTVTVETGPAQSAVAAAATEPTPTEIPTSTPTAIPTDTASPTLVATSTATEEEPTSESLAATPLPSPPAAKATPSPTATPAFRLSEIERIVNGGFEAGLEGWYIEGAITTEGGDVHSGDYALVLPADGGFVDQSVEFLAGTTYRLTGWGKVDARGDTVEFGVHYRDADGNRLTDLEPSPLEFTRTKYTEKTLEFTVPEGVARVNIYLWRPSGEADARVDDISLRSLVPAEDESTVAAAREALTILLMGVDARPGEAIDIGVRPDSLMVLRLNPETGSCRVLSIPRDTRTELPGYGMSKVNHALAVGGIPYQQQVVELLLGIPIDHYVLVDFAGFEALVDAVGGITIDVPEGFVAADGTVFNAGTQTMTGKQALAYARYRGGPDGDFGRIARQQAVLRAMIQRASGLNLVRSINDLLPAVREHIRTDLSVAEMTKLALAYRSTCTADQIDLFRLEGYDATLDDPLLNAPLWYLIVDEAEIRKKVEMLLEP